jgi:hypothetical protein
MPRRIEMLQPPPPSRSPPTKHPQQRQHQQQHQHPTSSSSSWIRTNSAAAIAGDTSDDDDDDDDDSAPATYNSDTRRIHPASIKSYHTSGGWSNDRAEGQPCKGADCSNQNNDDDDADLVKKDRNIGKPLIDKINDGINKQPGWQADDTADAVAAAVPATASSSRLKRLTGQNRRRVLLMTLFFYPEVVALAQWMLMTEEQRKQTIRPSLQTEAMQKLGIELRDIDTAYIDMKRNRNGTYNATVDYMQLCMDLVNEFPATETQVKGFMRTHRGKIDARQAADIYRLQLCNLIAKTVGGNPFFRIRSNIDAAVANRQLNDLQGKLAHASLSVAERLWRETAMEAVTILEQLKRTDQRAPDLLLADVVERQQRRTAAAAEGTVNTAALRGDAVPLNSPSVWADLLLMMSRYMREAENVIVEAAKFRGTEDQTMEALPGKMDAKQKQVKRWPWNRKKE